MTVKTYTYADQTTGEFTGARWVGPEEWRSLNERPGLVMVEGEHDAAPPSPAMAAEAKRLERNALLLESDWTQLQDVPAGTASVWAAYRQVLRDLPSDPAWPNVAFPEKP
jgi:hypothetical protein